MIEHLLADPLRARIEESARRAYPAESCGLLIGRRDASRVEVVEAREARNLAASPRDRFVVDPADHLAAEERAAELGLAVVGAWHSHPDGDATPSELDRSGAWSGWSYLIVAVSSDAALEMRAWRLRGSELVEELVIAG